MIFPANLHFDAYFGWQVGYPFEPTAVMLWCPEMVLMARIIFQVETTKHVFFYRRKNMPAHSYSAIFQMNTLLYQAAPKKQPHTLPYEFVIIYLHVVCGVLIWFIKFASFRKGHMRRSPHSEHQGAFTQALGLTIIKPHLNHV